MENTPVGTSGGWTVGKKVVTIVIVLLMISGLGLYTYQQNSRFSAYVAQAETHFSTEQFGEAQRLYRVALEYKDDPDIASRASLSGRLDSSLSNFSDGQALMSAGNYQAAYHAFTAVVAEDQKRYNQAIEQAKQALILFGDATLRLATELADRHEYREATKHLVSLVVLDPSNTEAQTLLSRCQSLLDQQLAEEKRVAAERKHQQEIDHARSIVRIISLSTSRPNSAGGVNFSVVWRNNSDKVVKYIVFEVVPYNAVDDIVRCEIRRNANFRGEVTGPINPGVTFGYGYRWENAWYNNTITRIELVGVDVTYMDGSTARLSKDQIPYIIY